MAYQPGIEKSSNLGIKPIAFIQVLFKRFVAWASYQRGVKSINPSLKQIIEHKESVQQEILKLCKLSVFSTNSDIESAVYQEALSNKKVQLSEIENCIQKSLFTALNKTATKYPREEQ